MVEDIDELKAYEKHQMDNKIFALENPEPKCTSCISCYSDREYPPCNHCYSTPSGIPSNYEDYKKARERCDHYWIRGRTSGTYRCVLCRTPQDVDAKSMDIDNANRERQF